MRPYLFTTTVVASLLGACLPGCVGVPAVGEREAGRRVEDVRRHLAESYPIPGEAEAGTLDPYLCFALRYHPAVEAAYQEWSASVYDVTVRRSLPDPQLTLQFDYANRLMNLMPGVSFGYTLPDKRARAGKAALAAAEVAYSEYVSKLYNVAAQLRDAWIELAYADESLRLGRELSEAMDDAARATESDYVTAKNGDLAGIANLRSEAARQRAELAALEDRRNVARVSFKAAMGLGRGDPDPAWPTVLLVKSDPADESGLWASIEKSDPDLLVLRASVERAVAETSVADSSRTPDFSIGGMVDLKANPLMYRPQFGMTLPIWRDKIRAGIVAAQAMEEAAKANVKTREITLAAQMADDLYRIRAADRVIDYIDAVALPAQHATASISIANYATGNGMASAPAMARAQLVKAEIERLGALRERERAVTDLRLISAGVAPQAAPLTAK